MDGANAVDSIVITPRVAMSHFIALVKKGRGIRWLLTGKLGRSNLLRRIRSRRFSPCRFPRVVVSTVRNNVVSSGGSLVSVGTNYR